MNTKPILAAALALLLLAGCSGDGSSPSAESSGPQAEVSTQWEEEDAISIALTGDSAQCSSSSVQVEGGVITIKAAGDYLITGELLDGQVVVDASKEDTVRLILSNASISCSSSAAIYAKQAGSTVVLLADSTENTLRDGESYDLPEGEDGPDAALFAKDDLTIAGEGSLTVEGNYRNGIGSKDNLVIQSGSLTVTSANDGLRGRDSVTVLGGTLTIDAASDGIQSNNDQDAQKGWVQLAGGTFAITAGQDGIQAETALTISGGTYSISTGGGAQAAAPKAETGGGRRDFGGAPPEMPSGTGGLPAQPEKPVFLPAGEAEREPSTPADGVEASSDSYKGLKAGGTLTVTGGTFSLDCADDAVHSNGDLTVEGGVFTLSTGDDGFHADGALAIQGGSIHIETSYEGLEGSTVEISGGDIRLTASDDGVNAAGGSDGDASGRDAFQADSSHFIRITGGRLVVDAQGDGLDSNGDLYLDGGTVLVNGPTGGGDSALDYDGQCLVTGGVLAAAGSSGMAQGPSSSSNQNSLTILFPESQPAGTLINLSDSQGRPILSFAPSKAYQSLVLSSPELVQGEAYTLFSGGSCEDDADGFSSGVYTGGTPLCQVTLTDTVTSISSDGTAASVGGGFGGGPMGGRGQRPSRANG